MRLIVIIPLETFVVKDEPLAICMMETALLGGVSLEIISFAYGIEPSWHLPYNGFCLGSSGSHIARTISKSQIKTAVLKVLQF
ncbi:Casp8 And Fadd-Like Apoptosis Regulator [Manis pentadactyla]|nr:Casp8 And Fadd-Like Apoptosis Regulator [Manis pentadactyla]